MHVVDACFWPLPLPTSNCDHLCVELIRLANPSAIVQKEIEPQKGYTTLVIVNSSHI